MPRVATCSSGMPLFVQETPSSTDPSPQGPRLVGVPDGYCETPARRLVLHRARTTSIYKAKFSRFWWRLPLPSGTGGLHPRASLSPANLDRFDRPRNVVFRAAKARRPRRGVGRQPLPVPTGRVARSSGRRGVLARRLSSSIEDLSQHRVAGRRGSTKWCSSSTARS